MLDLCLIPLLGRKILNSTLTIMLHMSQNYYKFKIMEALLQKDNNIRGLAKVLKKTLL